MWRVNISVSWIRSGSWNESGIINRTSSGSGTGIEIWGGSGGGVEVKVKVEVDVEDKG